MTGMFRSTNPATGDTVWEGTEAEPEACARAVAVARQALGAWRSAPLTERVAVARRYAEVLKSRRAELATLISAETGKLRWESDAEVGSMIGKVEVSIAAQAERAGEREARTDFGRAVLRHRSHGVMAVLGPYNFPGHLPNGHLVPALLAGNTAVFKPSEITPAVGEAMAAAWEAAGLPAGVLNIVQGGRSTGEALASQDIDGLLFTGSAAAGAALRRAFVDRPHVILAFELGGNNPLIAWDGDPQAVATIVAHSAFITTGQRCSCARRLIVPQGPEGDAIIDAVADLATRLPVAAAHEPGAAFMGPLATANAASLARSQVERMTAVGVRVILPFETVEGRPAPFVTPAIIDSSGIDVPDSEIFAPVLQLIRVPDFKAAIAAANATRFGLSAGLLSEDADLWSLFLEASRAGIVNWNRPTTGAAANMPFGGLGESGNHRPSAYYAADYAAYPIGSFEADQVKPLSIPGL